MEKEVEEKKAMVQDTEAKSVEEMSTEELIAEVGRTRNLISKLQAELDKQTKKAESADLYQKWYYEALQKSFSMKDDMETLKKIIEKITKTW